MSEELLARAKKNLQVISNTVDLTNDQSDLEIGSLDIQTLQDFRILASITLTSLSAVAERYRDLIDPNFNNVLPEGVADDGEERETINAESIYSAALIDALFFETVIKKGSNGLTATINNSLTGGEDVFASFRIMTKQEVIQSRDGFMKQAEKQKPKLNVVKADPKQ